MRDVRISKTKLVAVLEKNRDAHRDIYEKAMEGYTRAAIRFFENELDKAVNGFRFQTFFNEPMPEDHTEDYDTVLEMLNMSEDDSFHLSQGEFRQYVQDEWGWKRQFTETSSAYLS